MRIESLVKFREFYGNRSKFFAELMKTVPNRAMNNSMPYTCLFVVTWKLDFFYFDATLNWPVSSVILFLVLLLPPLLLFFFLFFCLSFVLFFLLFFFLFFLFLFFFLFFLFHFFLFFLFFFIISTSFF